MMFDHAKRYKKKIGLWVDLTKTDRYYDKDVVEATDCVYLKLACKGHGECPSQEVVDTFNELADKFIRKKTARTDRHSLYAWVQSNWLLDCLLSRRESRLGRRRRHRRLRQRAPARHLQAGLLDRAVRALRRPRRRSLGAVNARLVLRGYRCRRSRRVRRRGPGRARVRVGRCQEAFYSRF